MRLSFSLVVAVGAFTMVGMAEGADDDLAQRAERALRQATDFYTQKVSSHGGYLWRYSADLQKGEGEGRGDAETVWVQPPGTPSVGLALLEAYQLTREKYLLDAARATGECLAAGQLRSGGWDYRIEFSDERRPSYAYRDLPARERARNVTTLDDNNTQEALRLLMQLDQVLEFKDERIHGAAEFALEKLLEVQYPNGAWPQRFESAPRAEDYPVRKAAYPEEWPRTYPGADYRDYYTLNDNTMADMIDVMFLAARIYGGGKYRKASERAGEFLLLAQMPDPQPAWAQQYDRQMHPAWARKFEPPAVTGGESQGVLRTLLRLYRDTGDKKYLEPVPRAIDYLRKSELSDGRLARFYELRTNKPLYFTRKYELTYDDGDLPTHYGFKVGHNLDSIQREYDRLLKLPADQLRPPTEDSPPRLTKSLEQQARTVIDAMDERGAWVEEGRLRTYGDDDATRPVIESRTFIRNLGILARYVAATRAEKR